MKTKELKVRCVLAILVIGIVIILTTTFDYKCVVIAKEGTEPTYTTNLVPAEEESVLVSNDTYTTNSVEQIKIVNIENKETTEEGLTEEELTEAPKANDTHYLPASVEDEIARVKAIEEARAALDAEEVELLARLIHAEAGNQDVIGKRLVADTVLNRVDSDVFPSNIHDVIYQPGQFSTASYLYSSVNAVTEEEFEIARDELIDRYNHDVLFFRTGYYHSCGTPLFQYGDHFFSSL